MKIWAVICTHNRAELLSKTLSSLNQVKRPVGTDIQILVIANACTDETHRVLLDYQKKATDDGILPLIWAAEEKLGKSNALNHALSVITQGILCFIDDDHRIDREYFNSVANAVEQYPQISLFCGKVIPDWTGGEPQWVHDTSQYRIYPIPVPHFELGDQPKVIAEDGRIPGGGNLFARKALFDRVGNFHINLGPQGHNLLGSEDSDFVLRALRSGEKVQYIPNMVQYHYVDPERLELNYVIKKSFQRSYSITLARLTTKTKLPKYLWRKLFIYLINFIFSFEGRKARFYLVRISSILGEAKAFGKSMNPKRS